MTDFEGDLNGYINSAVQQLAEKLDKEKEAYLLKLFGSIENARIAGAYFVIEDYGFTTVETDEGFKLESSFKIRPKTAEEIHNEIRSRDLICPVCQQPVPDNQIGSEFNSHKMDYPLLDWDWFIEAIEASRE